MESSFLYSRTRREYITRRPGPRVRPKGHTGTTQLGADRGRAAARRRRLRRPGHCDAAGGQILSIQAVTVTVTQFGLGTRRDHSSHVQFKLGSGCHCGLTQGRSSLARAGLRTRLESCFASPSNLNLTHVNLIAVGMDSDQRDAPTRRRLPGLRLSPRP